MCEIILSNNLFASIYVDESLTIKWSIDGLKSYMVLNYVGQGWRKKITMKKIKFSQRGQFGNAYGFCFADALKHFSTCPGYCSNERYVDPTSYRYNG
ncbi:hypothetical protein KDW_08630 [Dictyobacter vulcani]|uniref:Uncharacterized protein n=1 Tax=Dictyobacter vulcani TaxID=2607529 RepID=A0A5J4KKI0_9CHLR|nr:hypothetical protein KDW_08630 [Dictyobacter vulcani]